MREEVIAYEDLVKNLGKVPDPLWQENEPFISENDSAMKEMLLNVNDDLQDEIGERRMQFEAAVSMVDELGKETIKKFEMVYRVIVICDAIGGIALCLTLGAMILNI